jgi:hypoxia up-regulated 1
MSLTFYRGERMFGSDSTALVARKPELTFQKFITTVGRTIDHPKVADYKKAYFPYEIYTNDTSSHLCFKVAETHYTSEELIAQMMQYAKDVTKSFGGKQIKDCVITVPSSFTQHERQALFSAADVADLRVLSLIEENTAAALNYAIDRVFEEPAYVLYYNMGASSVQVSIVKYSSMIIKEGGKNKTLGSFEVTGKAWRTDVGSYNFDLRVTELLADRFNQIWNKKRKSSDKDVRSFARPMARLRADAAKIKEVLSANQLIPVKHDSLHDDLDLSTTVTRSDFETAVKDLVEQLIEPIDRALANANITTADLHAVELLGGGVRVPAVKAALEAHFKTSRSDLPLGQHLNGDEAMALGAAFRAANLSTAFRVRKIGATDISSFAVNVQLETLPAPGSSGGIFGGLFGNKQETKHKDEWKKETTLYAKRSPVPSKSKTLAFNYDNDILCRVEYAADEELPAGTSTLLGVFNITGVAEFAKEAAEKGLGVPKVHLSFTLDSSGIVALGRAEATVELPPEPEPEPESEPEPEKEPKKESDAESESESESGSEGEKTSESTAEAHESAESKESDTPATEDASSGDKASGDATDADPSADGSTEDEKDAKSEATGDDKSEEKTDKKKKKAKKIKKEKAVKKETTLRRTLEIKENFQLTSPQRWSPAAIAEARGRLRALQEVDRQRKAREAALNQLETYIYSVKAKISDDETELAKVSTEEQREKISTFCMELEDWLYEDGMNADVAGYKAKEGEIRSLAEPIFHRSRELTARPAAIVKAKEQLASVRKVAAGWSETMPHIAANETEKLEDTVAAAEKWLADAEERQTTKESHEEPAFDSTEVPPVLKPVSAVFQKLLRKPKPPPPTPVVNATAANTTAVNGTSTNETAAGDAEDGPVKVKVNVEQDDNEKDSSEEQDKVEETNDDQPL